MKPLLVSDCFPGFFHERSALCRVNQSEVYGSLIQCYAEIPYPKDNLPKCFAVTWISSLDIVSKFDVEIQKAAKLFMAAKTQFQPFWWAGRFPRRVSRRMTCPFQFILREILLHIFTT